MDLLVLTLGSMLANGMSRALGALFALVRHLLLDERIYCETQSKAALVFVLARIRMGFVFAERHEVFDGDMYPSGTVHINRQARHATNQHAAPLPEDLRQRRRGTMARLQADRVHGRDVRVRHRTR